MIKEAKKVDFYTTGRQLSDQDFARISEWIRKDKQKRTRKNNKAAVRQKRLAQHGTGKKEAEV
jgi:cytochrome c553